MEHAALNHHALWRCFNVENSTTCRHPLRVAIGDDSTATVRVLVDECAIHDVRDSFETAVWVPVGATWFIRGVINGAHLVHHDERINDVLWQTSKCAANGEAFTLKTLRGSGERANGPVDGFEARGVVTRKGQCVGGDCRHCVAPKSSCARNHICTDVDPHGSARLEHHDYSPHRWHL